MTQQDGMTGPEPSASQPGIGAGQARPPTDADLARGPAAPSEPVATTAPTWPSPYLAQGQSVPEAYPAPPQPDQPRYGTAGASAVPGQSLRPGKQGYPEPGSGEPGGGQPGTGQPGTGQPGTGQPGTGQPGYHPAYGQPGHGQPRYGQPQHYQQQRMGRAGLGGRPQRDPALAAAWERLLAMTVDWILILAAAFLVVLQPMLRIWHQLETVLINSQTLSQTAAQADFNNVMRSPTTTSTLIHFWLVAIAIAFAYFCALSAIWGATVGKRVLGLRIVDAANRSPISIKTSGLRAAAFLVGPAIFLLVPTVDLLGGLLWVADCFAPLLDARMQTLHDRAAGTVVIKKRCLDQHQPRPSQPW
jgi:uncharacterized RDD family membrane protein YckC